MSAISAVLAQAPRPQLRRKPRRLRVRAFVRKGGWEGFQLLQERRWWGWKTIDREEIPRDVLVSRACFGDTGGWVSKFTRYGRFGSDGIVVGQHVEREEPGIQGT